MNKLEKEYKEYDELTEQREKIIEKIKLLEENENVKNTLN